MSAFKKLATASTLAFSLAASGAALADQDTPDRTITRQALETACLQGTVEDCFNEMVVISNYLTQAEQRDTPDLAYMSVYDYERLQYTIDQRMRGIDCIPIKDAESDMRTILVGTILGEQYDRATTATIISRFLLANRQCLNALVRVSEVFSHASGAPQGGYFQNFIAASKEASRIYELVGYALKKQAAPQPK